MNSDASTRVETIVSDQFLIAAELKDEVINKLAQERKIRSIVNLRSPDESDYRERLPLAQALGVHYFSAPIVPSTITTLDDAGWEKVLQFLDLAPQPALVHCGTMTRAALATIMYAVTRKLISAEEGERKLNEFVSKEPHRMAAASFIDRFHKASDYTPAVLKGQPIVHCIPHLETSTCTYVVSDAATHKAAIIDCVCDYDPAAGSLTFKHADLVIKHVQEQKLTVQAIVETHVHADHLTAAQYIKRKVGGQIMIGFRVGHVQEIFGAKFCFDKKELPRDGSQFDVLMSNGQQWKLGEIECETLWTPGHTPACMTWRIGDTAFVGDTIFLPDVGTARCDFPGGSAAMLWNSIEKLFSLPDTTRVFVGHDYPPAPADASSKPRPFAWETTIAEEKRLNKFAKLSIPKAEFIKTRSARDATLGPPRLLFPSVQFNLRAGRLPPGESIGRHTATSFFKIPLTAPDLTETACTTTSKSAEAAACATVGREKASTACGGGCG